MEKKNTSPNWTPCSANTATGTETNYEQAVGKIVRITQRVDDLAQTGKGILDGMEWTVRTDGKEVLEKDTLARVIRISGVKLIVEPYKED